MKYNYSTFKKDWHQWHQVLQKGEPRLAFLTGNSSYLRDKTIQKTKKIWRHLHPSSPAVTLHKERRDLSLKERDRIFFQTSLLASSQLHVITQNSLSQPKKFKELMKGAHQLQHFVLWCMPTSSPQPPRSLTKYLPPSSLQITTAMLRPYELSAFAQDLTQSLRLKIQPQGLTEIIAHCGERPEHIEQTLKKMQLIDPHCIWGKKEVLSCMDVFPEQAVFKITDYLLQGDPIRAHLTMTDLLHQNTPVPMIIGALHYHLKQLVLLLQDPKKPAWPSYKIKRYQKILKKTNPESLAQAFVSLQQIDKRFKTEGLSSASTEIIFTEALESL